jgi:hypothetical protein
MSKPFESRASQKFSDKMRAVSEKAKAAKAAKKKKGQDSSQAAPQATPHPTE